MWSENNSSKELLDLEIASGVQPRITNKNFQKCNISQGKSKLCGNALTKFFVCCGIPFAIVENIKRFQEIVIPLRKQFVHSIKDFSHYSQTGAFFGEEFLKKLDHKDSLLLLVMVQATCN
ncbi:10882_t:CDS:2 [Entrophospora sp. SA101]|nr:10882_t:CDS:2 [Entrophospora sp. SA101]